MPLLFVLLFSTLASSHSVSLHDAKLFQLTKFSRLDLAQYKGKKFILVFFQTDCPPCREQLRALKCLKEKRPEVEVLAAGVGQNAELAREARSLNLNFPSVEATPKFLEMVDGIASTPQTFFVNAEGKITKQESGTRTCESWEALQKR